MCERVQHARWQFVPAKETSQTSEVSQKCFGVFFSLQNSATALTFILQFRKSCSACDLRLRGLLHLLNWYKNSFIPRTLRALDGNKEHFVNLLSFLRNRLFMSGFLYCFYTCFFVCFFNLILFMFFQLVLFLKLSFFYYPLSFFSSTVTKCEFKHPLYECVHVHCDVVLCKWLGAQDKFPYGTIKYILSSVLESN